MQSMRAREPDPDLTRFDAARPGFTIIEVVVVMLILAVATAITIPALLPPPADDDLTVAAKKIDMLFGIARDSAARTGDNVTVMIDSATGGVWLLSDADPDSTFAPAAGHAGKSGFGDPDARAGEPLDLPSSVRLELSKARAQFRFSATGAAFADSLVLRTPSGTHLVTIDPWNGHAILH
jgi:prepilin-type N-terminal cleavage/methylation domain-containing protein